MCSWIANKPQAHPGSIPNKGWVAPPNNDWRNAKITIDMRCKNLYLGPWAKICQHIQGVNARLTWPLDKSITFRDTQIDLNDVSKGFRPDVGDFVFVNGVKYIFTNSPTGGTNIQIQSGGFDSVTNLTNTKMQANAIALGAALISESNNPTGNIKIKQARYLIDSTRYKITALTIRGTPPDNALQGPPNNLSPYFTMTMQELNPFGTAFEPQAFPNYIFTGQLISDQLGFGVNSWGKKNRVAKVRDSGRVQVVLQYTPSDVDWEAIGNIDAQTLVYYNYVVCPVVEALQNLVGNSYMMVVHNKPQNDESAFSPVPDPAEFERVAGKLMIYGIKVEVP